MKRTLLAMMLFILFVLQKNDAAAIPTFGTIMPRGGGWQGGARSDLIFDRDVKDYESAKMNAYYYRASYGFSEWFCLDGIIGLGDTHSEYLNEKELRYPYNFSGGYGCRAKLYQNKRYDIDWVLGFQHVSTHPGKQWYRGRKHEIIWDEWQVSTVMSKRVWDLMPYCGMKWSFTYLISKLDNNRNRRLSNGSPVGLVVGTDVRMNDHIYLNIESRFFDETALNAGFTVSY